MEVWSKKMPTELPLRQSYKSQLALKRAGTIRKPARPPWSNCGVIRSELAVCERTHFLHLGGKREIEDARFWFGGRQTLRYTLF